MKVSVCVLMSLSILFASLPFVGNSGDKDAVIHQPIEFNHNVHTQDAELECMICHAYVESEEFAGRPNDMVCTMCHEEPITDGAEEAKLVAFLQSGKEIPWRRLYKVPSHVYYSHRRHVSVAKIECNECHGEIGLSMSPPKTPLKELTMDFCMDCHERQDASLDCNVCHR